MPTGAAKEQAARTCEECVHFKRYYIKRRDDSYLPLGYGICLYDPASMRMDPQTPACGRFSELDVMRHEWHTFQP